MIYCTIPGMALENGKFTSEQVVLPEYLARITLDELNPGEKVLVDEGAFIIDDNLLCWIDGRAEVKSQQDYGQKYVKVVRLFEGFVVDLMSLYLKSEYFARGDRGPVPTRDAEMKQYQYETDSLRPVVAVISTKEELLQLDEYYIEQFGGKYINKKTRRYLGALNENSGKTELTDMSAQGETQSVQPTSSDNC